MKLSINYKLIIQILIWGLLLFLPFFVSNAGSRYTVGALPGYLFSAMVFVHMGLYYTHTLYLYPRFFCRKRWWIYVLSSLALLWLSLYVKMKMTEIWAPEALKKKESWAFIWASSIDVYFISLAYCRIMQRIRQEKDQKERQAAQLATELKFLRSQISPHFLFNVLTNLVSLARKKSDKLESSLIMLSELMRYMLYDTQGKKVKLSTEIRYLKSYIELQKLRFGDDVDVEVCIGEGQWGEQFTIEPMLLIPFVENAFKHGVGALGRPQIGIRLEVKEGWMDFEVRNTYDEGYVAGDEESSGLGLNNVRTRLNLLYPKVHTLVVKKEDNWFHVTLNLQLI